MNDSRFAQAQRLNAWCLGLVAGALLAFLALAGPASGQAWTPERGSGSVTLSFQHIAVEDHFFSVDMTGVVLGGVYEGRGKRVYAGDVDSRSLSIHLEYGMTDRLALSGSLPYIASRYRGEFGHPPMEGRDVDGGSWNSGLQDLSVGLRYKLLDGPVVVTPFIARATPVSDYAVMGHAAIGKGLNQTLVGVNFGAVFPSIFTWVHARYSYAFVQKVHGIKTNRSDMTLAVGYKLRDKWGIRVFGSDRNTRGGLDAWHHLLSPDRRPPQGNHDLSNEEVLHLHDQLAHEQATYLGGGVTYSLSWDFDLDLSYQQMIDGANTHETKVTTLSLTWSF